MDEPYTAQTVLQVNIVVIEMEGYLLTVLFTNVKTKIGKQPTSRFEGPMNTFDCFVEIRDMDQCVDGGDHVVRIWR